MTRAVIRRGSEWIVAVTTACFSFTGLASAQSTITNTGPDSTNIIASDEEEDCSYTNTNTLSVTNTNDQTAVTGNVWDGWANWDPALWQNDGRSFANWWNGLTEFLAARNDGAGWTMDETLAGQVWAPEGPAWQSQWANWDPALWQEHGQSFGAWYNQLAGYLNGHSAEWMLKWSSPGSAGNTTSTNATTGDATNSYNSTIAINIRNIPPLPMSDGGFVCYPAEMGPSGGRGGGSSPSTISAAGAVSPSFTRGQSPAVARGGGGGLYYGGPSYYRASGSRPAIAPSMANPATAPVAAGPSAPVPAPAVPPAPIATVSNTISDTGPDSSNKIVRSSVANYTVSNTNNVSINTTNNQQAASGSVYMSGNTGGSAGTGTAANNGNSGNAVAVTN